MDDDSIIELFRDRNEQAISETKRKYGNLCYSLANNILNQSEDVEECVNDAYLAVWNSIPPERPAYLSAYICKIVKRLAIDKIKYNSASKRNSDFSVSLDELAECISINNFDDEIAAQQLGKRISEFLWTQSERNRKIFVRRYWYSDSVADIANLYHLNEKTVATSLFRTRNSLKKFLVKEGYSV